jgi:hypothetical protein
MAGRAGCSSRGNKEQNIHLPVVLYCGGGNFVDVGGCWIGAQSFSICQFLKNRLEMYRA